MDVILVGQTSFVLESGSRRNLIDRLRIFSNIEDAKQWCLQDFKTVDFNTYDDSGPIYIKTPELIYIPGSEYITISGNYKEPVDGTECTCDLEYLCEYFHIPGFMEDSKMREYMKISPGKTPCTMHIKHFREDGYYCENSDIYKMYSTEYGPFVHLLSLMLVDMAPRLEGENFSAEEERNFKLLKALDSNDNKSARSILLKWLEDHPEAEV